MQSVSSRIWTRITVFISYGDNDYTTSTSQSSLQWYVSRNYRLYYASVPRNNQEKEKKKKIIWSQGHHHHHHVPPPAQISLTLSRHRSLSSIAPGRSSSVHPVSPLSCCILVLGGLTVFAHPCGGVHRSMSLMSLSPLLQQCPACLVGLTLIIFVMRGRWPYSCCFVGCGLQDLFYIARIILV